MTGGDAGNTPAAADRSPETHRSLCAGCAGCGAECAARLPGAGPPPGPARTAREAVPALAAPVFGFCAGFFLSGLALPGAGEPLRAALGAGGLFLGALALYLLRRWKPGARRRG